MISVMKLWIALLCSILLSACVGGGGDTTPTVTDIQAKNLTYGSQAEFTFNGSYLDRGLDATVPHCSGQTPVHITPTQQILRCKIYFTGDLTVKVQNGAGAVVFTKTFNVPPPQVAINTSMGDIVVELNPNSAPISVDNFLRYIQSGFYFNTIFHRVIPKFVIQTGGYSPGLIPKNDALAPIMLESFNGLSNLRGTLAMARTAEPNSATSQFYFNLENNTALDYKDANSPGYAVFGTVVKGLDIMDAIGAVPTATQNGLSDVPVTEVVVKVAVRIQ